MSKKMFAFIVGLVGLVCTGVTIFMNYFEPHYADQIRTVCEMIPPFCADVLIIFVATDVTKRMKA